MNRDQAWVKELRTHLVTKPFTYFATFNYGRSLSGGLDTRFRTVSQHIREWNRDVLETLFGKRFAKRNRDDAFMFVAVIEIGTLLQKEHVHLLIAVPPELRRRFEAHAAALWKPREIAPPLGQTRRELKTDVDIQRISDLPGVVDYVTKQVSGHSDRVLYSYQFRRTA